MYEQMYAYNRNDEMSLYPTSKTDVYIQTLLSSSIDFIFFMYLYVNCIINEEKKTGN